MWDKTGRNIVDDRGKNYSITETRPPHVRSRLIIRQVDKSDAGIYTCRATQFTPTISQFKQVDIPVRVQYKPKFPPGTPDAVWIDKQDVLSGKLSVTLNITCILDSDPPAYITWYDRNRNPIDINRIKNNPDSDIFGIINDENMSILQYRYKVTGQETSLPEIEASTGQWPPPGTAYKSPSGRANNNNQLNNNPIKQPDVSYECVAKNDLGSVNRHFALKIGDLPPVPTVDHHIYSEVDGVKNFTITINQPPVEPPVDYYRLELNNGQTVEFNSSK